MELCEPTQIFNGYSAHICLSMRKYSDFLNLGLEEVWSLLKGDGSGLMGFPAAGQNLGNHGLLPQSLEFFLWKEVISLYIKYLMVIHIIHIFL